MRTNRTAVTIWTAFAASIVASIALTLGGTAHAEPRADAAPVASATAPGTPNSGEEPWN